MKTPRRGDVVRLVFLDHADGEHPCRVEAFGRVRKVTATAFVVAGWQPMERKRFSGESVWTVLRSTIQRSRIYERK